MLGAILLLPECTVELDTCCVRLAVPTSDFAGQEIDLSLVNDDNQDVVLQVQIDGGIRLIKAFWTSRALKGFLLLWILLASDAVCHCL